MRRTTIEALLSRIGRGLPIAERELTRKALLPGLQAIYQQNERQNALIVKLCPELVADGDHKRRVVTEETRRKLSAIGRKKWKQPSYRKRQLADRKTRGRRKK